MARANSGDDSSDELDAEDVMSEWSDDDLTVDTSHLDEPGPGESLLDAGKPECPVCSKKCNTERGVKSHFGQKHKDKEFEDYANDDEGGDETDGGEGEDTETDGGQVVLGEGEEYAPGNVATPDDDSDDGGSLSEYSAAREQSMKTVSGMWDDARKAFEMASVNGTDATRRDALSVALKALENECQWMSVRERSGDGYQDLHRWVEGEGWDEDAHGWIAERMDEELDTDADRRTVTKAVHHLAVRNKVDQDTLNAGEFDSTLIPVANGVINVDDVKYDAATMSIDFSSVSVQDMKPGHRFTYRIYTEWDPEAADFKGLDEWVEKITATDDDVRTVWEFAGHSLHPRYPVDGFSVFVGEGGSGKSMLLKVIKRVIGEDETSSLSISKMETNNFVGPHVVNSRANINTELNGTKIKSIQTLKTMSAGEEMYVEQKREKGYEAKNDATMIFASDNPPAFPDDNRNRALKRRLYPVEFPGRFVPDPDPNNPYEFQYRPKPVVEAELQSDARLKAVLMRSVEGLVRLLEGGDFTTEMSGDERLQRYESFADPSRHFAFHCLEPAGPDSQIESGVFQATVDAFCGAQDHSGKSLQQIRSVLDDMTDLSYSKGRTRSWSDEQTKHTVYTGLRFSKEALRNFVPDHAKGKLDLSAVHEAEADDTTPTAIDDHGGDDDDGESVIDTEAIDRAVLQHADGAESVGELAGRVFATVDCNDLSSVKHRIEKLQERGDIILQKTEEVADAVKETIEEMGHGDGEGLPSSEVIARVKDQANVDSDAVKSAMDRLYYRDEMCEPREFHVALTKDGGDQ